MYGDGSGNEASETVGRDARHSATKAAPADGAPTRYRAPALDKGLDILELLAGEPAGLTRSEIVRAMHRSPSEIYRMIERLVARRYVARSAEGDRYSLTMKLFILGAAHPPVRRLVTQAQPLMDAFASETMQSAHLVVNEGPHAVVVAQASHQANWEFRLRVGAQLDMLDTGSGQTLLAFQDADTRARILRAAQPPCPTMPEALLETSLAQVRAAGHRIAPSKQLVGVTDISVPVFAPDGNAVAVLTCPHIDRVGAARALAATVDGALENLQRVAERLTLP